LRISAKKNGNRELEVAGQTISQKILAAHCGRDRVLPGEIVNARIDRLISGEINALVCIKDFDRLENVRLFDKESLIIVPDHYAPNKDVKSAEQCRVVREFCKKHEIPHYYEVGRMGIEHVLMHEKGFVAPGELIAGADSHSCTHGALGAFATGVASTDMLSIMTLGELWLRVPETIKITFRGQLPRGVYGKDLILHILGGIGMEGARYKAIEFYGEAVSQLSMDSRFTLCNMAVECGAKTAIIPPDEKSLGYAKKRCHRDFTPVHADEDAQYSEEYVWDASNIKPQVALPHAPDNVVPVDEIIKKKTLPIHQVFIGSCTNGRMEDLRIAADVLKDRRVHSDVRLIVIPGSQEVYLDAMKEGLLQILVEAGAAVSTPTCGPCLGGHMGVLAAGERCVSTSNRNFQGRMGHLDSEVYLAGVPVAAASAVLGRLALPEELS
jgi:3-isopropylmalate/(R)-2-methylmalate dehydratase large subunit